MSNDKRFFVLRIITTTLLFIALLFGSLTFVNLNKIKQLNKQIDTLKTVNSSLEELLKASGIEDYENYAVLTFIDLDSETEEFFIVDKRLKISIYDFLLTKNFTVDDFVSLDNIDWFFGSQDPGVYIKTEVKELEKDSFYYDEFEGDYFLIKGLQAIIIDRNLTVIRSKFVS